MKRILLLSITLYGLCFVFFFSCLGSSDCFEIAFWCNIFPMEWTASSMVSASRSLALFFFWILSILFTTALSSCSNSTEHYYPYQPDQKAMASLLTSCRKFILSGSILYMIPHWDTDPKRGHSKTRREHSHAHISSLLNCHQSIATNDSILSWGKNPETPRFSLCRGTRSDTHHAWSTTKADPPATPRNSSSAVNQNTRLTRGHQTTPDEWVIVSNSQDHRRQLHHGPPDTCACHTETTAQITLKGDIHCIFSDPVSASPVHLGKNDVGMFIDAMKNRGARIPNLACCRVESAPLLSIFFRVSSGTVGNIFAVPRFVFSFPPL